MVRVRADRLKPLQEAGTSSCNGITYIAAAARVANALTHDVLLAPIESSVIPLPHQLQALVRAIANNKEIGGWQKYEKPLELSELLEENFLRYDGRGEVPSQIHSYLSTNFKELRNLPKYDPGLRARARDRWYVPDPNKAGDLEKLRERTLLREFDEYRTVTQKRLKVLRLEAVRAGFKKAWQERDYRTIIDVAQKIPEDVLQEDPKLLMWYDQAMTRTEGGGLS